MHRDSRTDRKKAVELGQVLLEGHRLAVAIAVALRAVPGPRVLRSDHDVSRVVAMQVETIVARNV